MSEIAALGAIVKDLATEVRVLAQDQRNMAQDQRQTTTILAGLAEQFKDHVRQDSAKQDAADARFGKISEAQSKHGRITPSIVSAFISIALVVSYASFYVTTAEGDKRTAQTEIKNRDAEIAELKRSHDAQIVQIRRDFEQDLHLQQRVLRMEAAIESLRPGFSKSGS